MVYERQGDVTDRKLRVNATWTDREQRPEGERGGRIDDVEGVNERYDGRKRDGIG